MFPHLFLSRDSVSTLIKIYQNVVWHGNSSLVYFVLLITVITKLFFCTVICVTIWIRLWWDWHIVLAQVICRLCKSIARTCCCFPVYICNISSSSLLFQARAVAPQATVQWRPVYRPTIAAGAPRNPRKLVFPYFRDLLYLL